MGRPGDASITGDEYNVSHNATSTGNFADWSAWIAIPGSGVDAASRTIEGLKNGKEYRYHLRAANAASPGTVAPDAALKNGAPEFELQNAD